MDKVYLPHAVDTPQTTKYASATDFACLTLLEPVSCHMA